MVGLRRWDGEIGRAGLLGWWGGEVGMVRLGGCGCWDGSVGRMALKKWVRESGFGRVGLGEWGAGIAGIGLGEV